MLSINNFISEKLKVNSKSKVEKIEYKYHPKMRQDLADLIDERIKENTDDILDLNDIDTSEMITMEGAFGYKKELTKIDISNWDVSKVKYMSEMFAGCKNLESIGDISDWKIDNLIDITAMFYGCEKLTNVGDLNKWDPSGIKYNQNAFSLANKDIIPEWA